VRLSLLPLVLNNTYSYLVLESAVTIIRKLDLSHKFLIHTSIFTIPTSVMYSLLRSRTGLKGTDVDKTVISVIHITWESAILPAICMVVAVGLYHAAPVSPFF